jgi:hypothetical protein
VVVDAGLSDFLGFDSLLLGDSALELSPGLAALALPFERLSVA